MTAREIHKVRTASLALAYEEHGAGDEVVILLHGFPYSPRAYDAVAPALAAEGLRVLVPHLRGYGSTRFLAGDAPRSGQQAALGQDLLDFMDALAIPRATLVGYDWGGRAACIVAALWPERVRALVTGDGYNIQNIAVSGTPAAPEQEFRYWYQFYFHTPRGHLGLEANRRALCRLLWQLWSPTWRFDEATYAASAEAFDNPDFVEVVIHSYRHRYGYAPGDPALEAIERQLAAQPAIGVPTLSLSGLDDGVGSPPEVDDSAAHFTGPYRRQLLPGVGHNIPQEAPGETVAAVLELLGR
ncbi:alpha/beta fold hydrolase [Pseudomonas sp. TUM22785]|uniref:alpha/beta fold hydrolase n=1 Tax=Pseudomonas sp. TUM22785 TaxID=3019098 RepID=UPI002305EEF5|nr:alpha/beta hydrolase [Pseudomonas sp. TUM22785]WCD78182.1 alpha/beta hydrolase [Pseudomonas sp. TUM22785]